jgi:hypothetical protein
LRDANIGIVTGAIPGLDVVDVDAKHGGGASLIDCLPARTGIDFSLNDIK